MTVRVHDSAEGLAGSVAAALLDRLATAQERGEQPQVGLTGGTIADLLHRELAERTPGSGVDWSRVGVWFGDERFVPADSPDRNVGQAREAFLDQVGATRVHEIGSSDDFGSAEEAAAAYADDLRAHAAGGLEVLMLGIGPDGHVASLFPGHPAVRVDDREAVAVHGSPKPPADRVSVTLPALNRARSVWFLASGEGKADAVARAVALTGAGGAGQPRRPEAEEVHACPAAGVLGSGETVWHLDPEAASALPPSP